ncbi:LysM peptidoglycan-binding domain-containing protein [Rhizobium herbae]|uniref:LysM peptidoglycan-binding domain-containing protein n=1 Tax=Rhizobium herbae TaxID=508661 RepID=A0ABS7HI03_9HYPH|nr:LysM peptidoglycan-binding domain-containing protein [Rhizobium herbae]MBW9066059.1 LysM peptidoglycan-binding domain-containing protein [Rhizobium herbae]
MMKNKAGWVALIVLAIASLLMVFFVLPNINKGKDTLTADAPADKSATLAEPKSAKPTAGGEAATDTAKSTDPVAAWTVPGFDVLRVEPDGSTVIAGRAQPNTKLEIMSGDTVIGTADVGAEGNFAAVFEKPLAAGDYQLTLRSVGENGATKSSEEVATVSIPKDKAGELLAMVSKPGEASRIITKPVAEAKPADGAAEPATAAGEVAKAEPVPGQSATATPTDTSVSSQTQATGEKPAVSVSAVEIEGRKIFVAGNAKAGALVRVYADDKPVGEIKADEQGRFVVEGAIDLPVGGHTIRADVMGADGSTVETRASVPFDRPAGDQVAAVAQPGAQGTVTPLEGGSFDGLRMEATKALGLLKGLFADGKVPTAEELAAARSATEIALKSLADFKVADNLDAGAQELAAKTAKSAADALAVLKALPADAASVSASLGKIEAAVGSALMPRTDGAGGNAVATTQPVQNEVAKPAAETAEKPAAESATPSAESGVAAATGTDSAAPAEKPVTGQAAAEPETVQQAPLQQSKTSVIIRRGDTLWQISRRVYGAGVRYTTIYLANEGQIADPDRILPGQIFGVPDEAMSETEAREMHRKRVKHLP